MFPSSDKKIKKKTWKIMKKVDENREESLKKKIIGGRDWVIFLETHVAVQGKEQDRGCWFYSKIVFIFIIIFVQV
jgi:hypothetical protein